MHNLQFFHISNTFGCRTTSIFEEEVLFPQSGGNTGPIPLRKNVATKKSDTARWK